MHHAQSTRTATLFTVMFVVALFFAMLLPSFAFAAMGSKAPVVEPSDQTETRTAFVVELTAEYNLTNGELRVNETLSQTYADVLIKLCEFTEQNPNVRFDLDISPFLLRKWTGMWATEAEQQAVLALANAVEQGRIELLKTGFADPSFSLLSELSRENDLNLHYAKSSFDFLIGGVSSEHANALLALLSNASVGTLSADGTIPNGVAHIVSNQGISWIVADAAMLPVSSTDVCVFVSSEDRDLDILAADYAAGDAWFTESGAASTLPMGDSVLTVKLPADIQSTEVLVANFEELVSSENAEMVFASDFDAAARNAGSIRFCGPSEIIPFEENGALDRLNSRFSTAYRYVSAMQTILYSANAAYTQALEDYLVAETNSSLDVDARAQLLLNCSNLGVATFGGIKVAAEDMILAGKNGEIPVNISNSSENAYEVTVRVVSSNINAGDYATGMPIVLYSGDNFFEIPVTVDGDKGVFVIEVLSGEMVISSCTISISTSYINVVTAAICAVLIALFLVHRIRKKKTKTTDAEILSTDA